MDIRAAHIRWLFALAIGVSPISSELCLAESPAPSPISETKVSVSTPAYQPDFSKFRMTLGTYEYKVSWEGIEAADAAVTITQEGMRYRMVVTAKTYSGIDLFYSLRYRAEGLVSSVDLQPLRTLIDQRENRTHKNTQIEFLGPGNIRSVRSKNGGEVAVTTIDTGNFTLDPLSAGLLARSLPWSVGTTYDFDAFNGKTRYLISLKAESEEVIRVNGIEKKVWVIAPQVRFVGNNEAHKKLRKAKIYVTADDKREILKIVSSVFIGSVTTALEAFTPATAGGVALTQVAARERVLLQ
jgi:hypothetical protein